jgi:hypothetical protein
MYAAMGGNTGIAQMLVANGSRVSEVAKVYISIYQ